MPRKAKVIRRKINTPKEKTKVRTTRRKISIPQVKAKRRAPKPGQVDFNAVKGAMSRKKTLEDMLKRL